MASYVNKTQLNWNQINCDCLWSGNLFKGSENSVETTRKVWICGGHCEKIWDTGLRDNVVESGFIDVGSIGRVLHSKG